MDKVIVPDKLILKNKNNVNELTYNIEQNQDGSYNINGKKISLINIIINKIYYLCEYDSIIPLALELKDDQKKYFLNLYLGRKFLLNPSESEKKEIVKKYLSEKDISIFEDNLYLDQIIIKDISRTNKEYTIKKDDLDDIDISEDNIINKTSRLRCIYTKNDLVGDFINIMLLKITKDLGFFNGDINISEIKDFQKNNNQKTISLSNVINLEDLEDF